MALMYKLNLDSMFMSDELIAAFKMLGEFSRCGFIGMENIHYLLGWLVIAGHINKYDVIKVQSIKVQQKNKCHLQQNA